MAEVEIIPWIHNVRMAAHEDVVRYIRTLPKNSVLAIEFASKGLDDIRKNRLPSSGFTNQGHPATLEIMHECEKRNIKIIPLESSVGPAKYKKACEKYDRLIPFSFHMSDEEFKRLIDGLDVTKEAAADKFREEAFARNIISALRNFRGAKLRVLVGAGHAKNTKEALGRLGVKSAIRTDIFANPAMALYGLHTDLPNKVKERLLSELRKETQKELETRLMRELRKKAIMPKREITARKRGKRALRNMRCVARMG